MHGQQNITTYTCLIQKVSPQKPEGREGDWKYGYTHSYYRNLTEVRGQPHDQSIYSRLKLKSLSHAE